MSLRPYQVMTHQASVDLGDATGEAALAFRPPVAGWKVLEAYFTITTAGTGTGTHTISVEMDASNLALTEAVVVDADAAAGTTYKMKGNGNAVDLAGGVANIQNTEGGTISDGAIGDVTIIWAPV